MAAFLKNVTLLVVLVSLIAYSSQQTVVESNYNAGVKASSGTGMPMASFTVNVGTLTGPAPTSITPALGPSINPLNIYTVQIDGTASTTVVIGATTLANVAQLEYRFSNGLVASSYNCDQCATSCSTTNGPSSSSNYLCAKSYRVFTYSGLTTSIAGVTNNYNLLTIRVWNLSGSFTTYMFYIQATLPGPTMYIPPVPTTVPPTTPAPTTGNGLHYIGCYDDTAHAYTGNNVISTATPMTPYICNQLALNRSYAFFALENGFECRGGNSLPSTAKSTKCTMACAGDSNTADVCGGYYTASVYATAIVPTTPVPTTPAPTTSYPGQTFAPTTDANHGIGCFYNQLGLVQNILPYLLNPGGYSDGTMTLEKCAGWAANPVTIPNDPVSNAVSGYANAQVFNYYGVENGYNCYAGYLVPTSIPYPTAIAPADACSTVCGGNFNEICGGDGYMSVYVVQPASS